MKTNEPLSRFHRQVVDAAMCYREVVPSTQAGAQIVNELVTQIMLQVCLDGQNHKLIARAVTLELRKKERWRAVRAMLTPAPATATNPDVPDGRGV